MSFFVDDQTRSDVRAAAGRLNTIGMRLAASCIRDEFGGGTEMTLADLAKLISDMRDAEAVIVAAYQEIEEAARATALAASALRCEVVAHPGSDPEECGKPAINTALGFPICHECEAAYRAEGLYEELARADTERPAQP